MPHPIDDWSRVLLARPLIQHVTRATTARVLALDRRKLGGLVMGPEWIAIIALVALFVVGTLLPINMGALAYVAAWLVGMYSLNLDEKEILAGSVPTWSSR